MTATLFPIAAGHHAIFGYGSLLCRASVERTLGRPLSGPLVPCVLRGWRRSWDIATANTTFRVGNGADAYMPERIIYLNVRPVTDALCNGVLFQVDAVELAAFDRREVVYDRVEVGSNLLGITPSGGQIWTYVGRPEHRVVADGNPRTAAIRATYLDIVECGLDELGGEFRQAYLTSTDPVPTAVVVADRRVDG